MEPELTKLALAAWREVTGQLAFMFAVPASNDTPPPAPPLVEVVGSFAGDNADGPDSGGVTLLCTQALGAEIAANMLGLFDPEEVEPEAAADALRETVNVLVGHLATEACGSRAVFNLAPPVASDVPTSRWTELLAAGAVTTQVEDSPALLLAWLAPEGAPA